MDEYVVHPIGNKKCVCGESWIEVSPDTYANEGWGSFHHFLLSYGLKIYNDEDIQEGKAILKGFIEGNRSNWYEEHKLCKKK
jgi:hypothetical protein